MDALFPLRMVNKFGLVSNMKVSQIFATDVVTSPMMTRIVRFGLKVKGLYNLRKENSDQRYVLLLFFLLRRNGLVVPGFYSTRKKFNNKNIQSSMEHNIPNSPSVNHSEAKSSGGRKINEGNVTINLGSNNTRCNGRIVDKHHKDTAPDVTQGSNHVTNLALTHKAISEQKQKEIDIQLNEIDIELSEFENSGLTNIIPSSPESHASLISLNPSQPSDSHDNQPTARFPPQPSLFCVLLTWTRKARPISFIESPCLEQIMGKKREAATVENRAVLLSKRAEVM